MPFRNIADLVYNFACRKLSLETLFASHAEQTTHFAPHLRRHTNRFAVVIRLQSASGQRFLSLEGIADRDTLRERVKPGATVGEEVLGAYEVRGGRPVTIAIEEGQVVLKMGAPRPGAQPADPMKMLRLAAKEAAKREKERPKERPGRR